MNEPLLQELDQELANTRKVLARVPMDRYDWKPHERSLSLGDLSNHVARLPAWGAATIQSESLDLDPTVGGFEPPSPAEDTEGLLAIFDSTAGEFREALEEASDEVLLAHWTLGKGGQEFFTMARITVLRWMILNHLIHHRGQLTVYLRMNDVPIPALYGPSADEEA
jgi:uncharacterized damage-inducible protein DinB